MQHRVDANMELARLLVAVPQTPEPRFDISRESQTRGAARWAAFGFEDRPVLAIHPGSSDASFIERRLPPDTVLQVIRAVLGGHPESRVLIILGPAEEALRQTFENCDPRIGIAAGVPLHETAYLLSRCKSLLVGDTGLGHLAAAVGTRVITIAGATQVAATRPWGTGNVVIRTKEQLACMPCYDTPLYGHCPYGARCLTSVMAADIVDAITPTLTEGRAEAP
jgi:ADP-heptose:LPS heptosyltransferase